VTARFRPSAQSTFAALQQLVRDGIGTTVAWRDSISEELNQRDLIASPIVAPSICLQFYLY